MKTAKDLVLIALFTALLLGGQLALSAVVGVEIVTVTVAGFCYCFGVRRGMMLVNVFTLLRCFIFGFFPTALILYFVHYNLFAAVIGAIGSRFHGVYSVKKHAFVTLTVCVLTACFSLLDDIITPLFFGFTAKAAKAYFVASIVPLCMQVLCAAVTMIFVFPALVKCCNIYKKSM